ncbi:translocation/assembly module TamB domain-containing protein [Methylicorpusculum oleiharenae]|uniref:translocation/assembly module TamB domain-containing protein n=1 Tax=Methylicorpusculum oleiharenae TaxID=1338687 RepID=UPI0013571F90|nr:translocation/assembly module TamB domain-containing protein [Methylicorpusculum oleiharenae]MCD2452171.1 translocation/assembly module TamB domain-containing protein [Methylicorpusculum oleiharenae]
MKRLARGLLYAILLCLLVLVGAVFTLIGTEPGTRWLLKNSVLTSNFNVAVDKVNGTLLGKLELTGIAYQSGNDAIHIDSLQFDWQPIELLTGKLHIESIKAKTLAISGFESESETQEDEAFKIPIIPIEIKLEQFLVEQLTYKTADAETLINRLETGVSLVNQQITVAYLKVTTPLLETGGQGVIELAEHFPLQTELNWRINLEESPPINGGIRIDGNLNSLRMSGDVSGPLSLKHNAQIDLSGASPSFDIALVWQKLQWPLTESTPSIQSGEGRLNIKGTSQAYTIELKSPLQIEKSLITIDLKGFGGIDALTLESLRIKPEKGEAEFTGDINWGQSEPAFQLKGHWKSLQWPLSGPPQLQIISGQTSFSGTSNAYQISLNTQVKNEQLPSFKLLLNGTGNAESLDIAELSLAPKSGSLTIKGHLSWADHFSYALDLLAKAINPAEFIADVPGSLNLDAATSGTLTDGKLSGDFTLNKLSGTLHKNPIEGAGKLAFKDDQLTIEKLHLQSGRNKLEADGLLTQAKMQLEATLNAPVLASLWPGLGGSLIGKIDLTGNYQMPQIKLDLSGMDLKYENDYSLKTISLKLDYPGIAQKPLTLDLLANDLLLNGQQIQRLGLKGSGPLNQHHFNLEVASNVSNVTASLNGSWANERWTGSITQLDLHHPKMDVWRLDQTVNLSLSQFGKGGFLRMSEGCLTRSEAALCFQVEGDLKKDLMAQARIEKLDLSILKLWLPEELVTQGLLNAKLNSTIKGDNINANLNAEIQGAGVKLYLPDKPPIDFRLTSTTLTATYQQKQVNADLVMLLEGQDFIKAQISGPDHALDGHIEAVIRDLTLLDVLVPEIEKVKGQFNADVTFSGPTAHPSIQGLIRLTDAGMDIPAAGIQIKNIQLALTPDDAEQGRLKIAGQMESGSGNLLISGFMSPYADQGFPADIQIGGNNFQISRVPEAAISVSPRLNITHENNRVEITGDVTIDEAILKINELPEHAVQPSEDEVILGQIEIAAVQPSPINLKTDISLLLGDKITFDGFGLSTQLSGRLRYTGLSNQQRMQGRVAMNEGRYKAYGQDLTVSKGEFLFNGPLDNPWLNIEATRKATSEDITAILKVTGPLKSPQTKVSSQPALPESEALAYLITGRSLESAGGSQSEALAKAALSYGTGQLSWLNAKLGIDELEFEEKERLEDSAVRLGKFISPDFYIGLSLGFFSNNYAVLLTKKLSKHFSLQTRAGETQRIDLKYHIDTE